MYYLKAPPPDSERTGPRYEGPDLWNVVRAGQVRGLVDLLCEVRSRARAAGVSAYEMLWTLRAEEHAASYPLCRLDPSSHDH